MLNWNLVTPSSKAMATFVVIANMVCVNATAAILCYSFASSDFNPVLKFVLVLMMCFFCFYYGLSEGMLHGTRSRNDA